VDLHGLSRWREADSAQGHSHLQAIPSVGAKDILLPHRSPPLFALSGFEKAHLSGAPDRKTSGSMNLGHDPLESLGADRSKVPHDRLVYHEPGCISEEKTF